MNLLIARLRIAWHCMIKFHTEIDYSFRDVTIKIKCKECKKIFYEDFFSEEHKEYFNGTLERELDEKENDKY